MLEMPGELSQLSPDCQMISASVPSGDLVVPKYEVIRSPLTLTRYRAGLRENDNLAIAVGGQLGKEMLALASLNGTVVLDLKALQDLDVLRELLGDRRTPVVGLSLPEIISKLANRNLRIGRPCDLRTGAILADGYASSSSSNAYDF